MKKLFILLLLLFSINCIAQNGTPVGTPYVPGLQYFFYVYKLGTTPQGSKKMMIINDSTDFHFYTRRFYLDSMGHGYTKGDNRYLMTMDSSTNKLGVYKWSSATLKWTQLTGVPSFAAVATSGSYTDLSNKPTIPAAQVNSDWNAVSGVTQILNKPILPSGTVTSVGITSSDLSISGSPITSSGNIVANLNTSGISAGTYNNLTVNNKGIATVGNNIAYLTSNQTITLSGDVTGSGSTAITTTLANSGVGAGTYNSRYTVDVKGRITSASNKSFNSSPGRTLSTTGSNNTFTISATRDADVTYTINFSASLTLTTSNGLVSLDYSIDGGSNWIPVSSVSQVFGVSITITTNGDQVLSGSIPANALVRIYRSSNTNVTVTMTKQQEVLD